MPITMEAVRALHELGLAVVDAVAAAPNGIPSGHLYAHVFLPKGISLEQYQSLIDALVGAKQITVKNHLLEVVK